MMRYLPQLLCFEVKPISIYQKTDYISLLVKASILNGYALNRIRNMGVRVGYLLFDAGFTSLALPHYLQRHGYAYAMHFSSNDATKRIGLKDGDEALYPCDNPFRIVRADDRKAGKSYLFATNMTCRPKRVLKRYRRRWGIETSYREHNVFLAKTTSRDYTVRMLYYAVAVCIYNSWCVFNVHQQDDHVIALEAKLSLLLAFFVPSSSNHPMEKKDDHG